MREKIFNKKIGLVLGMVGVLVGAVMLVGLVQGNSATADNSYNWEEKPVVVNIQVDLEQESDQFTVDNILQEIEKHNGHTTVFVTGEFASAHPDVVKNIETRGHQIAVHGWQKEEDLTLLKEQSELIQRAFSAVKNAVNKPEEIVDFKPQGYKFNDDTIKILQEFGAKSISGIFETNDHESFSACWHVQSLGEVTFPYPITNEFWAIPISEIKINSKDIPLDDEYINNPQDFLNYLLEKYNQQTETKDPLIFVVHPSITGANTAKLEPFSQFLEYVEQNGGKIKPLSALTHHTDYITNLNAISSTTIASIGEEITIDVTYTSNIWCPHYRFLMYGKYPGQDWQILEDVKEYCEFVYNGAHTFSRKFKVPDLPIGQATSTYTVRIVGRASYASCPPISDTTHWPNAEDFDVKKDIAIEVTKPLCIPHIINGPEETKIDVIFVPDDDYEGNITEFKQDIDNLINNQYGQTSPISDNMGKFNFYYTEEEGSAENLSLPTNFWKDKSCKFADAVAILHKTNFTDGTIGKVFSAEGSGTRALIHESGHAVFNLEDEYDRIIYGCQPEYSPPSQKPNIWKTENSCRNEANNEGGTGDWNPVNCREFSNCQDGWWRIDHDAPEVMVDNNDGFGVACTRRINYVFDQLPKMIDILYPCPWCPKYAEKLVENSVSLYLNINNDQLTLLQSEFSASPPPNYYLGDYPFRAEIISLTGELLGEYGFEDPRIIVPEIGYEGPTWIDNVDFPLILPYFHNARTVNIYNSAGAFLLSVDISQYTSGIIEGKVTDKNGNLVENAFIQVTGTGVDSTYTDEDGNYLLVGLKPGNYTINVTPNPYDNLMSAWASISVSVGKITTRDFVLNPAGSIAGTVTDVNGDPVIGVHLYLSGYEMPRYATNEEGKYIIPGLQAGTYTVNIDAPGYGQWYILLNNKLIKYGTSLSVGVALGQTTWVDFTQKPPPMPDIWVEPQSFDLTLFQGQTTDKTLTVGNNGTAILDFSLGFKTNYVMGDKVSYQWEDGVTGGTPLNMGDDDSRAISLPFKFNFYGQDFSAIYIGSNGFVDFVYPWPTDYTEDPIPSTDPDNQKLIAVLWDDWYPPAGGNVYVKTLPNPNRFVVTWYNIPHYPGITPASTFQLVLYESGEIRFNYQNVGYTSGVTVGLNDGDGIFYNNYGSIPTSGSSILFSPANWLSVPPTSGQLKPGEQREIILILDTTNLEPNQYKTYIVINSNDLDESIIYIPVNLTVRPGVPPDANIGGPYQGNEGSPITFDGSGSYDPDGTIVSYEWDLDCDGEYDDATGVNSTFTFGDDYSGCIGLKVTDNDGLTATASTTVTINNVPPTVEAGSDQEVYAGNTVNFSASFTDPGWLDTHKVAWDFGNGVSATGTLTEENEPPDATGQVTGSHAYYQKGAYTVTLTVIDDDGGIGTDTLQIKVKPIPATVNCDPDTLNLKSNGQWITGYIELPAGYDVKAIDGSAVALNGIAAYLGKEGWAKKEANNSNIMDSDGDGILERMVKFNRAAVQAVLSPGEAVTLTLSGKVLYDAGLADFEGKDTIRVIK